MVPLRSLCVFCGSSKGTGAAYAAAARDLGALLADRGIDLVYGGGQVGLMGEVADACLARGGRVIGVIPRGLFRKEVAHQGATELHEVASMHERKQLMYDRSDAFVALPGGLGTLDETAEIATWSQLGLHDKPIALVSVSGFWDALFVQLDRMVADGFLPGVTRELVQLCQSPAEAIERLASTPRVRRQEWIRPEER